MQPRAQSNLLFIPKIIFGGAVGLLAGYGALTLITGKGPVRSDEVVATTEPVAKAAGKVVVRKAAVPTAKVTRPAKASSKPIAKAARPVAVSQKATAVAVRPVAESSVPTVKKDSLNKVAQASSMAIELPPKPLPAPKQEESEPLKPLPPPNRLQSEAAPKEAERKPVEASSNEKVPEAEDTHKPSAIVTLKLDKPLLRVIAESDQADAALCDIGFSRNLIERGEDQPGYRTVVENMARGKKRVELAANIAKAGAAIEISVLHHNKTVVCELRPMYSLPSGDIQPLTVIRGTKRFNELTRLLDAAKNARDSLPQMRTAAANLKADLATAKAAISGYGRTPTETAAGRTDATAAASRLTLQVASANKKVAAAEQMAAREDGITEDLQKLDEISEYAKGIASVATVSVRFHCGDVTLPATEK